MARRRGIVRINSVATGTSAKTLLQLLAGTNHAISVCEIGIGFAGTDNTHAPVLVELIRQTTAGTMTTFTTEYEDDAAGTVFDTTTYHTATVEPTSTDVLRCWRIHPQAGTHVFAYGRMGPVVGAGDRIGLRVTAANDVNANAYMVFEE